MPLSLAERFNVLDVDGYIPTAQHFQWGGYETWLGSCAFEPHASEKLLDTLLEMVAEVRDPK